MAGGRPTDYKPEYCQRVVEYCSQGFTLTAFAAEIGVVPASLYEWAAVHKEFFDALARARSVAQQFWEKKIADNLENRNFQGNVALGVCKVRFADYREQATLEITGPGGGPLQVQSLTREELLQMARPVLEAEIISTKVDAKNDESPKLLSDNEK